MVITDLWKYYGSQLIFQEVSATIGPQDRIGLVGANGVGKTTLLRVLAREESMDRGELSYGKNYTIGYLAQENAALEVNLQTYLEGPFHHILDLIKKMRTIEKQLADPDVHNDEARLKRTMRMYANLQNQFEHVGGYSYTVQIRAAALGLGFTEDDFSRQLKTFSGGERMRASLARLLLSKPSLLILDEPTNHLDVEAVEWLEGFLSTYPKALLVVSHDRYFLDKIATRIWEIHDQRLYQYRGNYSEYLPQRELQRTQLKEAAEKQQEERVRIESFIRKFGAGTRARQAKSLEKRLQKMEEIEALSDDPSLSFRFEPNRQSGSEVVLLDDVMKAYGNNRVLQGVTAHIKRGERIGLIGPNGSGKSTLLKVLAGELDFSGTIQWGTGVELGYFSQNITFDGDRTVLEELYDEHRLDLGILRSVLARFLFKGDDVFKHTSVLSGGEKNRLALAKLLLHGHNFLLLDEPTNHLDIYAREALERALLDFGGTILFVSHDRYFIDKLATKLWVLDHGQVDEFIGNFTAYRETQRQAESAEIEREQKKTDGPIKSQSSRKKQSLQALIRERQLVEEEITQLEQRKEELEAMMVLPDLYQNELESQRVVQEYHRLDKQLLRCYERWENLVDKLQEG